MIGPYDLQIAAIAIVHGLTLVTHNDPGRVLSMKVIVAPDKFKGSLSAPEAARAIGRGVSRAMPGARLDLVPMADGGEGTVEALVEATGGHYREATVTGPLGEPVVARYGRLGDGRTAVIEMAAASGLVLVPRHLRDPLRASTFGTGELIRAAVADGADRLIVGIGGSATNDGGAGMAQALGYRLLDAEGHRPPSGRREHSAGLPIGSRSRGGAARA